MNQSQTSQNPFSNGHTLRAAGELPHGIVRAPQSVLDIVAQEEARIRFEKRQELDEPTKKRFIEDLTLQFYFENWFIAYKSAEDGPHVLAVGEEEIGHLAKSLPQDEMLTVRIRQI